MRLRLTMVAVVALAVIVTAPFVGLEHVGFDVLRAPAAGTPQAVIFWQIRLPRVLIAFMAGLALATGGAAFQALFRNPLATPFTLGVASGAAFGVALASRLSGILAALVAVPILPLGALTGAAMAVAIVWFITRLRAAFSTTVLLLAGVAMSFLFSSLILFVQYSASLGDSYRIVRWLMGGLGGADVSGVWQLLPFVVVGTAVVLWHARELDLLSAGQDLAAARGVEVERVQKRLFVAVSVMVGGVVAVCGPIAFVGMMAPHICRLLIGSDHRWLLPAGCLFGGAFLTLCDTLARTVMAPAELPVGVITSFLGGPFFLWLLLSRSGARFEG